MSRIRSVHPGLFTDEHFVALSPEAKVFFIGLWTEADDRGAFQWKPLTLKMKLLAGSDTPVEPLLAELEAAGRIKRYEIVGKPYGVVRNFCRFQRPQKPRSVYPIPDELRTFTGMRKGLRNSRDAIVQAAQCDVSGSVRNEVRNAQTLRTASDAHAHAQTTSLRKRALAPAAQLELPAQYDTPTENAPQMEREEEGGLDKNPHHHPIESRRPSARANGAEGRASDDALDEDEDLDFAQEFLELWPLFPRKVDRIRALEAFRQARRTTSLADLRRGLEQFAAASAGKERKYVARPETWLRNQRWLDEPDDDPVPGTNGHHNAGFAYLAESVEHFRDRCAVWFDRTRGGPIRSRWPELWGPAPGEPECRCPAEVLAEFGWSGEAR